MKRIFIVGVLILAGLVIAGALVFRSVSGSGSGAVEQWIGSQLQTIANSYLNPQLKFRDLDYTYPLTVSVKNLSLTAEDPANPGQTIDILGTDGATIELAEIPRVGQSLVIEKIILEKPLFSAVAVGQNSKQFVGFSNLLRTAPTTAPATSVATAPPATRPALSEVFKIRLIQLNDGRIVYNPRIPGTEPMELDQINTTLNIEPADAGWYKLNTKIVREPIFDLAVAADVNLDTFSARAMNIALNADLQQDKLNYLPPQLQAFLKQYEVAGALSAKLTGDLPIMEPARGLLQTEVNLKDANVTLGEYRIPVQSLNLTGTLESSRANLNMQLASLQGTAHLQSATVVNAPFDTEMKLDLSGMQLQELLAGRKEGEPLNLAGKLNGSFQAKAPLQLVAGAVKAPAAGASLPEKWGSGSVELTEGRLTRIPVIHDLTEAIGGALKIVAVGPLSAEPKDRVKIVVSMEGNRANVTEFTYVGELVAARGTGMVGLDRTLDLKVSAGPVERVQALLGEHIGGAIGAVTDKLLAYRVTGKIGDPQVAPVIGGGAIGGIGRGVQGGAEGVGQGLEKIGEGIGNILKPKE